MIAPSPKNPKHNIDIYLQPLIAELKMLWDDSILTYDVSKKQNFSLKAGLMWTISDFSAYVMLSGWSTTGKNACSYITDDSKSFYLINSRKVCWFDCHRRFLPKNHLFMQDRRNFMNRVKESGHAPRVCTGYELLEDLDKYGMKRVYEEGAQEYNDTHCPYTGGWKKRSIFWDLSYWKTNSIRYFLDVMHIEKYYLNNILNTIMCVGKATKDHLALRQDMCDLSIRNELHPVGDAIPKASYNWMIIILFFFFIGLRL